MSLRRADGRRQKAHLATAITIRRYMRPRYAVLAALVVCGFCYEGAGPAAAQSWPTRPLTMVVPFAPGGGTDVLGRIVGRRLSEVLGQQVIIDHLHRGRKPAMSGGFWRDPPDRVTAGVTG